ncbi:MAG: Transcriptional regulatorGntR family domain Aspartate aminotransferase [Chloroflexi bacterium]|nr:Transcriptional regulatorGntR family domain Aspartate aminotransferase [Chloroflexota bacterium]
MYCAHLEWQPDSSSPMPFFRQLAHHLRQLIRDGALPPGTQLPPQRSLAQQLGVNRSTIVAAYQELQADGLLQGRHGGGSVVPTAIEVENADVFDWQDVLDRGAFVHNRALAAEVAHARVLPGTISLAQGELAAELRPTATIQELYREAPFDAEWLGYEGMHGYQPLREAIAAQMTARGAPTEPENVLTLAGAQEGLSLICRCLLKPGDTVVVEAPSYLLTLGVLQMAGLRVLRAPVDYSGLIPSRLEELLVRNRVAMVFTVPNYQNPTGATLAQARRVALLDLCIRYRVPLVEDDVYGELGFTGQSPAPLQALDQGGHVIYLSSISKSVAPGLRIGWLIGESRLVNRLAEMKYQMHYGTGSVSQWVAQQWFQRGHHRDHLQQTRAALKIRSTVLAGELRRQFGAQLTWSEPQGGFHLWARVNAPISSTSLFRVAARAGVSIKPGSLYGVPAHRCWIRLSFQHAPVEQLREATSRLRDVVGALIDEDDASDTYRAEIAAG